MCPVSLGRDSLVRLLMGVAVRVCWRPHYVSIPFVPVTNLIVKWRCRSLPHPQKLQPHSLQRQRLFRGARYRPKIHRQQMPPGQPVW